MVRKTRKRCQKAGTIDSAAKIKATVIAVKKNSKTIKHHEEENNVMNNRIDLLESIVKKQEKQIDTLNKILMERLMLEHEEVTGGGKPRGNRKQLRIEYAMKRLQGRSVKMPQHLGLETTASRLNQLKGDWVTTVPEGPEGFKVVYKSRSKKKVFEEEGFLSEAEREKAEREGAELETYLNKLFDGS